MEQARAGMEQYGFNLWQAADSTGDNLGNGIKSITEDQANLLASYANAMRADLSIIRALQVQGWQDIKQIRALMPSPTVWELIAKIEAHSANIARNTAQMIQQQGRILSTLQAVITSEDGAPAFRALI